MEKKYLGIDYGESKVGLAIADSETRMAFGYGTLKNDKNLLRKLEEIIKKESIGKIIIGAASYFKKPLGTHGSKLGDLLQKKAKIMVEFQEEMFSTKQAQRNLIEKGIKGVKKYDDREAARIILQGWLDKGR